MSKLFEVPRDVLLRTLEVVRSRDNSHTWTAIMAIFASRRAWHQHKSATGGRDAAGVAEREKRAREIAAQILSEQPDRVFYTNELAREIQGRMIDSGIDEQDVKTLRGYIENDPRTAPRLKVRRNKWAQA